MTDEQKVKSAQALKEMRENIPAAMEAMALIAEYTRLKYLALLKQRFSEDQALELCR